MCEKKSNEADCGVVEAGGKKVILIKMKQKSLLNDNQKKICLYFNGNFLWGFIDINKTAK